MISLIGYENVLKNVLTLSSTVSSKNGSIPELKQNFRRYLASFRPEDTINFGDKPLFTHDRKLVDKLISSFISDEGFDIEEQKEEILKAKIKSTISSLETFQKNFENDYQILEIIVDTFFCLVCSKRGGGSSGSYLGAIWLSPKNSWIEPDFHEFFIHELTHQMLFIDERCHDHYISHEVLEQEKYFAKSSIRKVNRRLDLAIHSMVVGIEILDFRHRNKIDEVQKKITIHPHTKDLWNDCNETLVSINAINDIESLITIRMKNLLNLCQQKLNDLKD